MPGENILLKILIVFVQLVSIWGLNINRVSSNESSSVNRGIYMIENDHAFSNDRTGDICHCGRKGKNEVKIVGGVLSKQHSWPWVAAIVVVTESKSKGPKVVCGSSIISRKYLLTAGHCAQFMLQKGLDHFQVIMGTSDLNDSEEAVRHQVASARIHPRYEPTSLENDIALLELEDEVEYSNSIAPICLTPQHGVPYVDRNAVVAGWGSTVFGGMTITMQMQTMVGVISNAECQSHYKTETNVTQAMMCARRSNKDSCQGDSGGPLFLLKEDGMTDSYLQIGIVSFGKGCADSQYPGIYTRLSRFIKWIKNIVGNEDMCGRKRLKTLNNKTRL